MYISRLYCPHVTGLSEHLFFLQKERDKLLMELESLAHTSDETAQRLQEAHMQKLKQLETQVRCDPTKLSRQGVARKQISAACLLTGLLHISVALSSPLLSLGPDCRLEKDAGKPVSTSPSEATQRRGRQALARWNCSHEDPKGWLSFFWNQDEVFSRRFQTPYQQKICQFMSVFNKLYDKVEPYQLWSQ